MLILTAKDGTRRYIQPEDQAGDRTSKDVFEEAREVIDDRWRHEQPLPCSKQQSEHSGAGPADDEADREQDDGGP